MADDFTHHRVLQADFCSFGKCHLKQIGFNIQRRLPDWSLMNAEKKTHVDVERFSLEDITNVIVAFIGSFQNPKAINFLLCVVPPHCFSSHTLKISALRSDMYKPKRQSYSLQNKNEWEESIMTIACCSCVLFVAMLLLLYIFCC